MLSVIIRYSTIHKQSTKYCNFTRNKSCHAHQSVSAFAHQFSKGKGSHPRVYRELFVPCAIQSNSERGRTISDAGLAKTAARAHGPMPRASGNAAPRSLSGWEPNSPRCPPPGPPAAPRPARTPTSVLPGGARRLCLLPPSPPPPPPRHTAATPPPAPPPASPHKMAAGGAS